jgi:hypothetical protein
LLVLACSSETKESKTEETKTEDVAVQGHEGHTHDTVVELAMRNVSCGCALEAVGHCGNYVEIDSKFLEIANSKELGLGEMEWCGKEGVQVETAGVIKDGKFVAASLVAK